MTSLHSFRTDDDDIFEEYEEYEDDVVPITPPPSPLPSPTPPASLEADDDDDDRDDGDGAWVNDDDASTDEGSPPTDSGGDRTGECHGVRIVWCLKSLQHVVYAQLTTTNMLMRGRALG